LSVSESILVDQAISLFRSVYQNELKVGLSWTDGQTDGRTDRQTYDIVMPIADHFVYNSTVRFKSPDRLKMIATNTVLQQGGTRQLKRDCLMK